MKTILAVGNGVVDISVRPMNELDFNADSHLLTSLEMGTGGDTLNTTVHLTRLGVDVDFVCRSGDDEFSAFYWNRMVAEGIDTSHVKVIPNSKTTVSLVVINDAGERTFYVRRGVNSQTSLEDVDLSTLGQYRIVHSSNYFAIPTLVGEPTATLFREAQRAGCITTLDMTHDRSGRWMAAMRDVLPHLDYFLPSFKEARALTGTTDPAEMARILLEAGVRNVVIKLGSDGCYFRNAETGFRVPAYQVPVIDTCGAGDSFVAGFLAGLAYGWEMRDTCQFANALAANCVQYLGATTGRLDLAGVRRFMAETPVRPLA